MSVTYHWEFKAFRHDGRCDICQTWTPSGVRRVGMIRFRHCCVACAKNRFAGEITLWTKYGQQLRPGGENEGGSQHESEV
jgi:hypothetical protein